LRLFVHLVYSAKVDGFLKRKSQVEAIKNPLIAKRVSIRLTRENNYFFLPAPALAGFTSRSSTSKTSAAFAGVQELSRVYQVFYQVSSKNNIKLD
jgi:hypothetical protein